MIISSEWLKPKAKPYFHHISLDCIEKLVDCVESIDIEVIPLEMSIKSITYEFLRRTVYCVYQFLSNPKQRKLNTTPIVPPKHTQRRRR